MNEDDWKTVAKLQGVGRVFIADCTPPSSAISGGLQEKLNAQSAIQIQLNGKESDSAIWEYTQSGLQVHSIRSPFQSDSENWDAIFIGGFKSIGGFQSPAEETIITEMLESDNFRQRLFEMHLVFDSDRNPNVIRVVLIPAMSDLAIAKAATLTDLEVLSFDAEWINDSLKTQSGTIYRRYDFAPLSDLKKLRELYLPREAYPLDYSFLGKLPDLEILQFDAFHDSRRGGVPNFKAEFGPNLKQVRMVAEPHPKLLREFSKLETLECIDLIDSPDWFPNEEDQEKLKRIFDDRVEINFLKADEYPDPPDSFRQHMDRVKQDVRARRLPDSK